MIRYFKAGDEKAIAEIEKECFLEPWSEQAVLDSANLDCVFVLFEKDGQVVGYAGLQIVLDEGYITNIAVKKAFRKQGIATALINELLKFLNDKLSFISLEVRASNSAAIKLYKLLGFTKAGIRKNFYSAPKEDALIMTKRR
ncbi:MAG: ribosomal protein S18-alanine N-acetyltransferase [Clostridia bacterium]|nr:ribosomal protein S18-alanine N-acetyltransferase [Clostridia bacterium]